VDQSQVFEAVVDQVAATLLLQSFLDHASSRAAAAELDVHDETDPA